MGRRTPHLALAMSLALLAAPSAEAQTMYVPAPARPAPPPLWNCRARQPVGATSIHAARQLDAAGTYLSESASWTDADTANRSARLTLSVTWNPGQRLAFADGMAAFYFRAGLTLPDPLGVRLGKQAAVTLQAGRGYGNPQDFIAYVRLDRVLQAAGSEPGLAWALRGGKGDAATAIEGVYPLTEARALRAGLAATIAELDAMQADFRQRCARLK